MNEEILHNLSGKTLASTPYALAGGIFHKSLIYVLSHSEDGAMGLIFNRPVNHVELRSFFKTEQGEEGGVVSMPIYLGGPVDHERGFFLHSNDYDKNLWLRFQNDLAVSSNPELPRDIAAGNGPKNSLFIVGYTAWKAGQLEAELSDNLWIVMDCDKDFIFADHPEHKWHNALKHLGIEEMCFASQAGNA